MRSRQNFRSHSSLSLFAVVAAAFALLHMPTVVKAQTPSGSASERKIQACTHADIHAGLCVKPHTGRIAMLIDAVDSGPDRCRANATAGGNNRVLCRFDGTDWREVGTKAATTSPVMTVGANERVLDMSNPPPGSGLAVPVGDGIDGQPFAPRTNAAPAITAAIQYACDNDYDIAFLGPGAYRIGEQDTIASFYTGISIGAKRCPGGIKFYGAGVGKTVLLANGQGGQYLIFTSDEYYDPTKVRRIGWSVYGEPGRKLVTNVTTGVSPPVVTGSADGYLEDGDAVYVRNCSGTEEMNERTFRVNGCTHVEPFTCELQDEFGVDIDATEWAPWSPVNQCILGKLNPDFVVEIAYMTLRDDDPSAHSMEVCNPTCQQALEESHGIGVLQGGGSVEIHHVVIDTVGDEAIDISAPESPTYVHDVTILNPEVSGPSIYQGVGIRLEDILVHKGTPSTQYLKPFSAGDAFVIDAGRKNWRVVDVKVNRLIGTGGFRYGFTVLTNPTGFNGQYVSGVTVTNSVIDIATPPTFCRLGQRCGAFWIRSTAPSFPIEDIEVSGNLLTGTAFLEVSNGAGGLHILNNRFTPIPDIEPKWGIRAEAKNTTIKGNHVSGFGRGCIRFEPYLTNGGANATVTTTLQRNVLECNSNASNEDPMIAPLNLTGLSPHPNDEGYFHIYDNQMLSGPTDYIRHGIKITRFLKNIEICRNTINIDPGLGSSSSVGIWSFGPDQLICENNITIDGTGVRVRASGSIVVKNVIDGGDTATSDGIVVLASSQVLVSNNTVTGYQHASSSGIKIDSETSLQTGIRIVGNSVDATAIGIELNGNSGGLDQVTVAGNTVNLEGFGPGQAVLIHNATDVQVLSNNLLGLGGTNVDGLLSTGTTDFINVRDNTVAGGGTLKFGITGGDASCDPVGGVGSNSNCLDNKMQ